MNLQIQEWTDDPRRIEIDGVSFTTTVTICVVTPAKCTLAELRAYVQAFAGSDAEWFYRVVNHPVLPNFETYDTGIDALVHEVAGWLHERGLSIVDDPLGVWIH